MHEFDVLGQKLFCLESTHEPGIDLDASDTIGPGCQRAGEHAEPGADFDDEVARARPGAACQIRSEILVGQKVLAQLSREM